jgi:hypothetical protein
MEQEMFPFRSTWVRPRILVDVAVLLNRESFLLIKILKFKNTYNFQIVLAFCGSIINSGGRPFVFPMLMERLSKMIDFQGDINWKL